MWSQLKYFLGISAIVSVYGIASLAVYYLGPYLGLSITVEIVIIALLLLTLPFAILISFLLRRRARRREAAAAAAPAEGQRPGQAPAAPKRIYNELTRGAEEAGQGLGDHPLRGA